MNIFNINQKILNTLNFSIQTVQRFLNSVDRKTAVVATLVFSSIILLGSIIFYLKHKITSQTKESNKNLISPSKTEKQKESEKEKKPLIPSIIQSPHKQQTELEDTQKPTELSVKDFLIIMTFGDKEIEKAVDIFSQAEVDIFNDTETDDQTRKACEDYFKRALRQPQDKINITRFYQIIQENYEIIDIIFDEAVKTWSSEKNLSHEEQLINSHFCLLLRELHNNAVNKSPEAEKIYLTFMQHFLHTTASCYTPYTAVVNFKQIFNKLSENEITQLTKMIVNNEPSFSNLIPYLKYVLSDPEFIRVLAIYLPYLQDAQQIENLYDSAKFRVALLLSNQQIGILFQHWKAKESTEEKTLEPKSLEKLSFFLDILIYKTTKGDKLISTIGDKLISTIQSLLALNPPLDLAKLMEEIDYNKVTSDLLRPYICGIYLINHLKGLVTPEEKVAEAHVAIRTMNPFKSRSIMSDERDHFASFLAEHCPLDQVQPILLSFNDFSDPSHQRMAQLFLTHILANADLNKIQQAFTIYWSCYKKFPSLLQDELLIYIYTEGVLEAVYQSTPENLDKEAKKEIGELLKYGRYGGDSKCHYRVQLDQNVVNRVLNKPLLYGRESLDFF